MTEFDAMRALLEPLAQKNDLRSEKPLGTLTRILAEHKRLDRQMFLANSYNWNRSELTWETAARNLFNYVQVALGKPELPSSTPLLPSLVGKDLSDKNSYIMSKSADEANKSLTKKKGNEAFANAPIPSKASKVIFGSAAKLYLRGEEYKPILDFVVTYKEPSYPPKGKRWDYYRGWVDVWLPLFRLYQPLRHPGTYDIRFEGVRVVDKVDPNLISRHERFCTMCRRNHSF